MGLWLVHRVYIYRQMKCTHLFMCLSAGHVRDPAVPAMQCLCAGQPRRVYQLWRKCVPVSQVQVSHCLNFIYMAVAN